MLEIVDKLIVSLVGQANSSLVTWMIIVMCYLVWQNYSIRREHRDEIRQYKETLEKLQSTLGQKTGEERETLLDVIEKYHQGQISIREAITEVKVVLTTLATLSRNGG